LAKVIKGFGENSNKIYCSLESNKAFNLSISFSLSNTT